jgi:alkylated DNA repair dioxygenase AlkB
MAYRGDFISPAEESALLLRLAALPFTEAKYREYTAKRRIVMYEPEVPDFLWPLRERAAAWMEIPGEEFRQALVNEYRPGTALGWHRDSPDYGVVAGVSLGTPCVMRMRPYPPRRGRNPDAINIALEPRSGYLFRNAARWEWQHCIPATKGLRYSITFRTLRNEQ